jgi:ligand-binding SRPBCC domain-containing protein
MGVCRVKALISAPLPHLWDFLIRPQNMHMWSPFIQQVTGIDRPLQAGDRVTQWRKDFFRHYCQVLLVEEVISYRSLRFRDLSPGGLKMDARATISVEEARDLEATWIEEVISYSLGSSRAVQWLDCWLVNPVMQLVIGHKTNKAFRRLEALFGRPDKKRDMLE